MSEQHHRELATFRPMPIWPYPATKIRRSRWAFRASWGDTLGLLWNEVRVLDGSNIVIGGGWREGDIRKDGLPRSGAREPSHPGVEVSFDASVAGRRQRLVYATDSCERWEHNVRSIALGLGALRAVDRYGITRQGEQYAGFKALPRPHQDLVDRGRAIIAEHGGDARRALAATHPDHGGAEEDFKAVSAAREAA